jgi:cellulose synthase/poly-beta-1,6-N-acetylglucosamine synthase-like glycosyltransferase
MDSIVSCFRFSLSIGVMAYNEERNLSALLSSLMIQESKCSYIKEAIIVASGCTDNTVSIITDLMNTYKLIKLIVQKERKGKASAINAFFSHASGDILVLLNADTILKKDSISNLVQPFLDEKIGMTGARIVPVNRDDTFLGYGVHLFWKIHHVIALREPKLGELVAFRNLPIHIPENIIVDEAYLEYEIRRRGFHLKYAPSSVVINRGPENLTDFICQRKRIFVGHQRLKKEYGYRVSTCKFMNVLPSLIKSIDFWSLDLLKAIGIIILELYSRYKGYTEYLHGENFYIWDVANSTKKI